MTVNGFSILKVRKWILTSFDLLDGVSLQFRGAELTSVTDGKNKRAKQEEQRCRSAACATQGASSSAEGRGEREEDDGLEAGAALRAASSLEASGERIFDSEFDSESNHGEASMGPRSSPRWPSSAEDSAASDGDGE